MTRQIERWLARLPWIVALSEAACVLSLVGFFVANAQRVALGYRPTAARDALWLAQQARAAWLEDRLGALFFRLALYGVAPLVLLQASTLALRWSALPSSLARAFVVTALIGVILVAFAAMTAALSIGGGLIG